MRACLAPASYKATFEAANPDISLNLVRDSTGTMAARILAEKDNPRADVIWRLSNLNLIQYEQLGMLVPYAPKELQEVKPPFLDTAVPPQWVGDDGYFAAICFNTVEAKKKNLPEPTSWRDLANPVYKGQIVMPNPNASGTAFVMLSSWLQLFGQTDGWKFIDGLNSNVAQYSQSGSKPCELAATGEYAIGLSFSSRSAELKASGAPIDLIFPKEGAGWNLKGSAILKGTKNLAAAKQFMDWAISLEAMRLYSKNYAIISREVPGIKPVPYHPVDVTNLLSKNDFQWAAKEHDQILKDWNTREGSSTKKNQVILYGPYRLLSISMDMKARWSIGS